MVFFLCSGPAQPAELSSWAEVPVTVSSVSQSINQSWSADVRSTFFIFHTVVGKKVRRLRFFLASWS